MKKICLLLLLLATSNGLSYGQKIIMGTVVIHLVDSVEASQRINISDEYTRALNPFELKVRLNKNAVYTETDYLNYAAQQTQNWTAEEKVAINDILDSIDNILKKNEMAFYLPTNLYFIKTSAREEFQADAYTRGDKMMINFSSGAVSIHLIAHELFHIFSRFNKRERDNIYSIFGYQKCNILDYTDAFSRLTFTNPDCPLIQHYTTLKDADTVKKGAVILYSLTDFQKEKELLDYIEVRLLELDGNRKLMPKLRDGKPIVHSLTSSATMRTLLKNTSFALHPEEIAAEHFAMMFTNEKPPRPEFLTELKKLLRDPNSRS